MHHLFINTVSFYYRIIILLWIINIKLYISTSLVKFGISYLCVSPKAKSSTVIVYGPEKSWMTPSLKAIPVCPMNGKNHDIIGRGVHTMQRGNLALDGSITASCTDYFFFFAYLV